MASVDLDERVAAEPTEPKESLLRRVGFGVGYSALVFLGWVALFGPSNITGGKRYFTSFGGVTGGDHVQITYYMWLWWHALTTGSHSPWTDPFQFAATGYTTHHPFGWPLVLVSIPVHAIFGPVGAFNAVMYLSFIAAAGATYLWTRALNLPRYAAAIAGFSFAFCPFRLAQRGHINSYVSFLLPLALYGAERALRGEKKGAKLAAWIAAASIVSLCASGEMHVVVFFAPMYAAYLVVRAWSVPRERLRSLIVPAVALAVGSLFFLGLTLKVVYQPSVRAADRAPDVPWHYAPRPMDLVRRSVPSERTAYPGMITFGLAAIGIFAGFRRKNLKVLTWTLLVIIVGATAVAMLPAWRPTGLDFYNAIKIVHRIRDPGRIIIVVALAFACLAAIGASRMRLVNGRGRAIFAAAMMGFLLWDVAGFTRNISAAAVEPNLYPKVPQGASILELPVFNPGHSAGSRYEYQIILNPGPRVAGYSVFATPEAQNLMLSATPLSDVPPSPCRWSIVSKDLHFDYVAVHKSFYGPQLPKWTHSDGGKLVAALDRMPGLTRVSEVRDVVTYRFDRNALTCRR